MGKNKTNKELWFYVAAVVVLVSIILLLITEAQFPNGLTSSGIVAIISAVLGVLLTVAVTAILLNKQGELQEKLVKEQSNLQKELINQQSEQTEEKEKQVKVFEKKQEVYHAFLDKLQEIIQDGKVKVGMNADGDIDKSVDQLKDLFFQLGYLQMHCSDDTFNTVLDEVARIIQNMHDYASTETLDKQNKIPEFYAELFMRISTIVSALKEDLYQNKGNGKIEEKRM
jgi:mannitol-specific phosphotransferase system IIBC component